MTTFFQYCLTQIINVIRNPRDVCLSFLNHLEITNNYTGGLDLLTDIFVRDVGPFYGPFFKQKTAYEIASCLVGSEMCIRDRIWSRADFKLEGNLGLIGAAVTGILHCNVINHAIMRLI